MSATPLKQLPVRTVATSGFIIGPVADSLLIIGAPLVSLVVGAILFSMPKQYFDVEVQSQTIDSR